MYSVKVKAHFSAAHNLRGYKGRCENLHGHNWKVEAEVSSARLNNLLMVCDFREIKNKLAKVLEKLDHAYLNKIPYFKKYNPTSEKIAEFIYFELKKQVKRGDYFLRSVCVWETDNACAVFREGEA